MCDRSEGEEGKKGRGREERNSDRKPKTETEVRERCVKMRERETGFVTTTVFNFVAPVI